MNKLEEELSSAFWKGGIKEIERVALQWIEKAFDAGQKFGGMKEHHDLDDHEPDKQTWLRENNLSSEPNRKWNQEKGCSELINPSDFPMGTIQFGAGDDAKTLDLIGGEWVERDKAKSLPFPEIRWEPGQPTE